MSCIVSQDRLGRPEPDDPPAARRDQNTPRNPEAVELIGGDKRQRSAKLQGALPASDLPGSVAPFPALNSIVMVETLSFDGIEVRPKISASSSKKARRDARRKRKPGGTGSSSSGAGSKKGGGRAAQRRAEEAARERAARRELNRRKSTYARDGGRRLPTKRIADKKLRRELRASERRVDEATESAARAEVLLAEEAGTMEAEGVERTWRFSQDAIRSEVDTRTASRAYNLDLNQFGPYNIDFTRNGKFLLLAGRKGHLSVLDWKGFRSRTELHVRETVRDAVFLHDEKLFAVAQKRAVYIYDGSGVEVHVLRNHSDTNRLTFLPYHFLLASVGKAGRLRYQDTSTGTIISQHRSGLGECDVLSQNPANAVVSLGHSNGSLTMWSPAMQEPLAKLLCHRAPVLSTAFSADGRHMVTSGLDGKVKVWDVRKFKELYSYSTVRPAASISVSQMGLVSLGFGPHVQVWKGMFSKKQKSPYLVHRAPGDAIRSVRFCPYEDFLGVGSKKGFSSLVVPGSGEPNFDSLEANPFDTRKQARERTVQRLLDKLPFDMISLDSDLVGRVDAAPMAVRAAEDAQDAKARRAEREKNKKDKKRARGRNSSTKRWRRKRGNIMDERTAVRREKIDKIHKKRRIDRQTAKRKAQGLPKDALSRFL